MSFAGKQNGTGLREVGVGVWKGIWYSSEIHLRTTGSWHHDHAGVIWMSLAPNGQDFFPLAPENPEVYRGEPSGIARVVFAPSGVTPGGSRRRF